jgi:N-acyl-D-amino-acid deacylase
MIYLLELAFEQGAIGLSVSLAYAPGVSFEEVMELSKIVAKYGRFIGVHLRYDGWKWMESINEFVQIARLTGVPLHISCFAYQAGMGIMEQVLKVLDKARQEGIDVTADSGMYEAFAALIGTPVYDDDCFERWGCGYKNLIAVTGKYAGMRCNKEMFQELREKYKEDVVAVFACKRKDIYKALLRDYMMVSSDGALGHPNPGFGHPQSAGTFPKFFQKMVKEKKMISLTEAVRKATLLPVQRLGLENKGRIKEGADADIVIFDLGKIKDKADYLGTGQPDAPPEGINYVIINGQVVVDNGEFKKGVLAGKTIRV